MESNAVILAKQADVKNLKKIQEAFEEKRIDQTAKDYLDLMYGDSMTCFRNLFYFLGLTLGAPKTPIYAYDPATNNAAENEMSISDVGPCGTYIVHHRFDNDPMRNQFFNFAGGIGIRLFVSSIASVIVSSQKNVSRAIDKVTGKYYDDYLEEVLAAVAAVLTRHKKSASVKAISEKIEESFRSHFISNPSGEILKIAGNLFPLISVDLVRELDKIEPPFARLKDVYRMKLLFDIVPQVNAFIDHAKSVVGDRILTVKNKFYDFDNDRNYRDAKIITCFDFKGQTVPIEIIMNVRTFFAAERQSHNGYKNIREDKKRTKKESIELHHGGIADYNRIICRAAQYLFHRVGWNIMYESELQIDSFFRGFPEIKKLPYSQKIVDTILEKIDGNVENEIFRLPYAPRPLSQQEELLVFRYMARFILFSALPYAYKYEEIPNMGFSGDFFNFVMKELYRYYENDVL